jgi:hypothetical protein
MKRISILIILITFVLVCQAEETKIKLFLSAKATKEEILKRIPIGSNLEDAKRNMEANGFSCKKMEKAYFSEQDYQDKHEKPTIHANIDYLYCDKEVSESLYCARRWQVAIVHNNGIVSDVLVSTGRICV